MKQLVSTLTNLNVETITYMVISPCAALSTRVRLFHFPGQTMSQTHEVAQSLVQKLWLHIQIQYGRHLQNLNNTVKSIQTESTNKKGENRREEMNEEERRGEEELPCAITDLIVGKFLK